MAGIGSAHAARSSIAVARERVGSDVFDPEFLFDGAAKILGTLPPARGRLRVAAPVAERGHGTKRGVGVALHLNNRDRPMRERAVGMEDGVVAVFPALIDETVTGARAIADEPIAIVCLLAVKTWDFSRLGRSLTIRAMLAAGSGPPSQVAGCSPSGCCCRSIR